MFLKFIGEDNSMGLRKGQIYDVVIKCSRRQSNILVIIPPKFVCPYSSPQTFAENWSKP